MSSSKCTLISYSKKSKFCLLINRLLKILERIVRSDETESVENVLSWMNMLVTCHYLQMVMSKDEEAEEVRTQLYLTVTNIQDTIKALTDCRVSVQNLLQTKTPPVTVKNQAYSIQIIQI